MVNGLIQQWHNDKAAPTQFLSFIYRNLPFAGDDFPAQQHVRPDECSR